MNLACPQCDSKAFKRNGYTRHGKQNHRCLDCGKQFSLDTFDIFLTTEKIESVANPVKEGSIPPAIHVLDTKNTSEATICR